MNFSKYVTYICYFNKLHSPSLMCGLTLSVASLFSFILLPFFTNLITCSRSTSHRYMDQTATKNILFLKKNKTFFSRKLTTSPKVYLQKNQSQGNYSRHFTHAIPFGCIVAMPLNIRRRQTAPGPRRRNNHNSQRTTSPRVGPPV